MSSQSPTHIFAKDIPTFVRLRALPVEQLLKEPVESLPLSTRAKGYCQKNGITTIGRLSQCKRSELMSAKNMGRATVYHIVAYLKELGLGLDGKLSAALPSALPPAFLRGARAMKIAVVQHLSEIATPIEVVQSVAELPLPDREEL